ncbi:MAG: bifunctional pyr operon transcriptional regulator/uracil phosphoribosyltransferase PyrR [Christensenellaceae bacterium]
MIEIMNAEAMGRCLKRLAHEVIEHNDGIENVVLLGIRRRGVTVANRLKANLEAIEGKSVPCGELDITLYRDDLIEGCDAVYHGSIVNFDLTGKDVVLCDDVLFTGRTVRSALSAIMTMGRPKSVQLLVMVDRGHRELPFRSDYTGKNVPSSRRERIYVRFTETDGTEGIYLKEQD